MQAKLLKIIIIFLVVVFGWKWNCDELNGRRLSVPNLCLQSHIFFRFMLFVGFQIPRKGHVTKDKRLWLLLWISGSYRQIDNSCEWPPHPNVTALAHQTLAFSTSVLIIIDGVHSWIQQRVWKATAVIALYQNHGHTLQKSMQPSVNINHTQCQDSKHWHLTLS